MERIANFYQVPVGYFFDEEKTPTDPLSSERLLSIIESQQRTIENLTNK